MFEKQATVILALIGLAASSATSFAFTGVGCPDLPEYDRAVGTIENGAYSCGMSMEEAKRILARGPNGDAPAAQPVAPVVHLHHRHHHKVAPVQ